MKSTIVAFGAMFAANIFAASSQAAVDIPIPADARKLKLGLWEVTSQSESVAPPIDAKSIDMSGLDAAARARVEATLKKQAAERAARGGAPQVTTHTKRECLTQEALDKRQWSLDPENKRDKQCPPTVKTATASRLVLVGNCAIEGMNVAFEMEFFVKSPEETVMKMSSNGNYNGQAIKSANTVTSRWVGAACGDARPMK
jgi:hypothetical protein